VSRPDASASLLKRVEGLFDQYERTGFIRRIMLVTPPDSVYVLSESDVDQLEINRLASLGSEPPVVETPDPIPEPVEEDEEPPPPPADYGWRFAVYQGLDFYGNDIWSGKVTSEQQCRNQCSSYSTCVAYTFNDDANYCFVKDRIDVLAPYTGAIGGQVLTPSVAEAPIYDFGGIDPKQDVFTRSIYEDSDLAIVPSRNENDCIIACIREESCAAFSFNSSQRQCYLKESANWIRSTGGWTSGIKQRRTYYPSNVVTFSR
jgi:hypothetical protein